MSNFIIVLLFIVLIFLLFALYAIASFGVTAVFGAPYVGTPKRVAREMLKFSELKKEETFMDLGSGSGTLLLLAVKEFGAKKAIGYEINPLLVLITKIRARIWGIHTQIEVRQGNIFKEELPVVDVLGLYLLSPAMNKLFPRLKAAMSPGTRIVSRGFQFKEAVVEKKMQGITSVLYLYLLK